MPACILARAPQYPVSSVLLVPIGRLVDYAGQPVAIVLADSQRHALDAARAVATTYTGVHAPVTDLRAAIQAGSFYPTSLSPIAMGEDITVALANSDVVITVRPPSESPCAEFVVEQPYLLACRYGVHALRKRT